MRIVSVILALAIWAILLPGCGSDSSHGAGRIVRAIAGNGGSEARASVTSDRTVIGGIGDGTIGQRLDAADRQTAALTEYRALEYGQSGTALAWKSLKTPTRGSIVPGKPYKQGGVYCRAYTHTLHLGDTPETVRGTACRSSDGAWRTA